MTAPSPSPSPNMATLTASLERSLRNCSLNHTPSLPALSRSNSSADSPDFHQLCPAARFHLLDLSSSSSSDDTTALLDLNSHVSLPYHWEQCLDLQTGEIYYKNWRNGMRAKEDPRLVSTSGYSNSPEEEEEEVDGDEDEEEEEEEDESEEDKEEEESYDSEGSSSNSYGGDVLVQMRRNPQLHADDVLVVAGCKSCLMYYMVPKQVLRCPKCTAHLLHFDRPDRD